MSSSVKGSSADVVLPGGRPLDEEDSYTGYGPRLSSQRSDSQRYDSFSNYADGDESSKISVEDNTPYVAVDDVFSSQPVVAEAQSSPTSAYAGEGFSPERNGNSPILPPPANMQVEEGFALTEWRRQNAIRLVEKEKREKEKLKEIILEAEEYKAEYYNKWKLRCENNRAANREKEKLLLESQEKFHAEVSKNYWKGIGELIPKEVPIIEKKGKKDQVKRPTIVVIQGPKPGKPTDLSRMRQILVKLKHNPPSHMRPPPSPSPETGRDAKTTTTSPANLPANSAARGAAEASSTTAK